MMIFTCVSFPRTLSHRLSLLGYQHFCSLFDSCEWPCLVFLISLILPTPCLLCLPGSAYCFHPNWGACFLDFDRFACFPWSHTSSPLCSQDICLALEQGTKCLFLLLTHADTWCKSTIACLFYFFTQHTCSHSNKSDSSSQIEKPAVSISK